MSQLELPGIITYRDGSWEIINLNPKKIRGDISKNYPLGNPMHGFTLAIQNDFRARKRNLETNLQSELNQIDNTHPPLAKCNTRRMAVTQLEHSQRIIIQEKQRTATATEDCKNCKAICKARGHLQCNDP